MSVGRTPAASPSTPRCWPPRQRSRPPTPPSLPSVSTITVMLSAAASAPGSARASLPVLKLIDQDDIRLGIENRPKRRPLPSTCPSRLNSPLLRRPIEIASTISELSATTSSRLIALPEGGLVNNGSRFRLILALTRSGRRQSGRLVRLRYPWLRVYCGISASLRVGLIALGGRQAVRSNSDAPRSRRLIAAILRPIDPDTCSA